MKIKRIQNIGSHAGDVESNKIERPKKHMPNDYVWFQVCLNHRLTKEAV